MGVFQMLRKAPQAGGLGGCPPIFPSSSKVNETHQYYMGTITINKILTITKTLKISIHKGY